MKLMDIISLRHRRISEVWMLICAKTIGALLLLIITEGVMAHQIIKPREPMIWFGPMQDHYDSKLRTISWTHYDFLQMLTPGSQWAESAHLTDALILDITHAAEGFREKGEPSLPEIHAMLKARGIRKVGGGGAVVYTAGSCQGAGVEGMSNDKDFAHEVVNAATTWHDAGLPLDYFVMDGPFYFGYEYSNAACHFSIADVARRSANTMRQIRGLYPHILVIDAEGPGKEAPANWLVEYHQFLSAFQEVYRRPVDYVDLDLHWVDTWKTGYRWAEAAQQITRDMHNHGIRVSLIINAEDSVADSDVPEGLGKPFVMSPGYWMTAVRKHLDIVADYGIPVDAVDLESWMKFPTHNLPESDPLAWTSIVRYARDRFALKQ